jgi:tetratricopeptide (TPR) repeat protein
MRRVVSAALLLLVCPIAVAQHFHHVASSAPQDELRGSPCTKKFTDPILRKQFQLVTWDVTGKNDDAKKFFSQGMTEYYGFNYEEAMNNFRMAKAIDPTMAMAPWGIALAAGPNINLGMDNGCRELALREAACAMDLARQQKGHIPSIEEGLINALPLRYSGLITETVAFSVAMRQVWLKAKKAWEDDPSLPNSENVSNVGALYAESLLEMRPWGLFDAAYRPALDTDTIYEVLLTAMKAERDAIGANHFWIHTAEASDTPDAAKDSANVLRAVKAFGHLIHMPSHIDLLTGHYADAMTSNSEAVRVDNEQYGWPCRGSFAQYSKDGGCPQLYYGHYVSHNLFFRAVSATFRGQSEEAVTSACDTKAHVERFLVNEPGLQRYMTAPLMTLVMNRNWDAVLQYPAPPDNCYMEPPFETNGCHIIRAMRYWARGMAHAARGEVTDASNDDDLMAVQMKEIAPPTPTGWGNNSAAAVLAVAQSMLQARYTWAGGQCKVNENCDMKDKAAGQCNVLHCSDGQCEQAFEQAVEHLKLAVTHEDALVYDEPPQWFAPTREALGGAYLQTGDFKKAKRTFQEALCRNPGSGRALYGLMRALEGLPRPEKRDDFVCKAWTDADYAMTAGTAKAKFCKAWKDADYAMTDADLWPAKKLGVAGGTGTTCDGIAPKPPMPSASSCKIPAPVKASP